MNDMISWRVNFSFQVLERSHLPIIGIAFYSLSLIVNEERKYQAKVYWKNLTILSTIAIILYVICFVNSSHRGYLMTKQSYVPSITYEENLDTIKSSIEKIKTPDEAKNALRNASARLDKKIDTAVDLNLQSLKERILELETSILSENYANQEKKFNSVNRKNKFDALRYILYSSIFIIFYIKLTLFFNRLYKSS